MQEFNRDCLKHGRSEYLNIRGFSPNRLLSESPASRTTRPSAGRPPKRRQAIDNAGLTLAVTDLDHWLETRVPAIIGPFTPGRFLIPAEALKAATRGDKGSSAHLAFTE